MKKLILYSVSLVNLAILLGIVISSIDKLYITFLFLTILSFTLSTIYLLTMWIYEIRLHFNKKNLDKFNQILECRHYKKMRERVFKFVFTIEVTVCISYWILCLGGESIMVLGKPILLNVYLHCFIGVQLVLELLLTDRTHHPHFFIIDYLLAAAIITAYSIFLVFISKTYDLMIYPFLKLELTQILAINLFLFLISFNVYQFLHFILDRKTKNKQISPNSENFLNTRLNEDITLDPQL